MAKYNIIPSSRTIEQSPISIGHKAEKGVEAIEFDLTAWVETYGSGTLTVIMRRWGDAIPYPIALKIDENNKATWTLSDTDTAKAGMAYAQLSYIVGDTVVKKSDIYTFRVMDSLTGEGEPPEAYGSWLEHLTHFAAEAMAEVLDIEGIVTDKTLTVDGGIADGKATGDALALKADKSTTYTKTEVDRMIEGVEVETDTTLSVSGAAADAKKTGDEITALKADLGALGDSLQSQTGVISKVEGSYINLTTDPVSLTPVVNAVWAHSVVSCAGGDTFIINADGGQMPRAWGFLDSSNHVLSVADESTIVNGLKLTAPTNAVKLIINDRSGATSYIVGNNLASNKVDIQQSPSDYGKALVIDRDGQVRPGVVSGGSGLTDNVKMALLACFRHVYWNDEHSVDYYNTLEAALYAAESRLTAVINYGNATIFTDDPLGKVRWMMKVYYDGVEVDQGDYALTGDLIAGKNVLTVSYNDDSTSILVEAEKAPASRLVLTEGDILKFDGLGLRTTSSNGVRPPYLVPNTTTKTYYASKGHAPYKDENNNFINGKYPIPIPAFATHVRVSVAPNEYKIALNCWKYNNSTFNYSFIDNTDTGYTVHHADVDVPQFEGNARVVNVLIEKPDGSAFDASSEPTQVVVQFT